MNTLNDGAMFNDAKRHNEPKDEDVTIEGSHKSIEMNTILFGGVLWYRPEYGRTNALDEVIESLNRIQKQPFGIDDRGTKLYRAETGDLEYSIAIDDAISATTELRDAK